MSVLPSFMVIGAGKSGTTSVYEYLKQHPEVFMSEVKETNFFALEGKEIKSEDQSKEQTEHYPWSVNNRAAYEQLFEGVKGEKAVGEVSPMYLYNAEAPAKIKEAIPEIKLIAILRQPVERLYSRYMHLVRENREPSNDFSDALQRDTIWWRRNDLVSEGFYAKYLERYYALFEADQIKVFLYEDLKNNRQVVMKEMFDFIGVDSNYMPETGTTYNQSGKIKNKRMDAIIGQNSVLVKAANQVAPGFVKAVKSSEGLRKAVNSLRAKNLEKVPLAHALKQKMTLEIYESEIKHLQTLLNRNLDHWLV